MATVFPAKDVQYLLHKLKLTAVIDQMNITSYCQYASELITKRPFFYLERTILIHNNQ